MQLALCSLTKPIRHGIMVAVFYGALAIGYHLAGRVGAYWPILPKPVLFSGLAALVLLGCGVIASHAQWLRPLPTAETSLGTNRPSYDWTRAGFRGTRLAA